MNDVKQAAIQKELDAGTKLTVLTVREKCHTTELRKYISNLRRAGLNILSEWCRSDNGDRFKSYWLEA